MYIALAAVAIIGFLYWLIKRIKEQRELAAYTIARRGFDRVENPDPELREKLARLYGHHTDQVSLSNIYRRQRLDYDIYCFNAATGDNNVGSRAWAIVSPRLDLPRLAVVPEFDLPGFIDKMWDALIDMVGRRSGLTRIESLGNGNGSNIAVYAADEAAVIDRVPASAWQHVNAVDTRLTIQAEGDTVIFQPLVRYSQNLSRDKYIEQLDEELRVNIDLASHLHDLFAVRAEVGVY